jgi:predicted dehydrogenase
MSHRVAIIGAGIGAEHLEAYRNLPGLFDVRVMCDLDAARARNVVGQDAIRVVTELQAVLSDDGIDLVDICLPPHLHVSTALAAIRAGKVVICEKPIACNLADIDQLIEVANQRQARVFPVFQYRYGPALAQLRALIDNGMTGKAFAASFETHWSRDAAYYDVAWRGTWEGEQGGAILGHAIHAHDLMTWALGPVAHVSASLATRVNPIETDDCAAISCQMQSGALVSSSVTLGAATDTSRIKIMFENLTAESGSNPYAPGADPWTFTARGELDQAKLDRFVSQVSDVKTGFAGFLEAAAHDLKHGTKTCVSLEDGRRSVELVTAIYQAARSGERVALPLDRNAPLYKGWQP